MSTLTFTTPPPGLAPLVDFGLDAVDGARGLYTLQSVKDPSKRMFVVDAAVYVPAYSPAFNRGSLDDLAVGSDRQVLVIATAAAGETPTVNLLAPIVVNREDGRCTQVILDGDYPVKAALTGQ